MLNRTRTAHSNGLNSPHSLALLVSVRETTPLTPGSGGFHIDGNVSQELVDFCLAFLDFCDGIYQPEGLTAFGAFRDAEQITNPSCKF